MKKTDSCDSEDPRNNLDWTQFEAITCSLLPEFITVYREFERELPQLLKDLRAAIADASSQKVASLAHQIKGSAANFGFVGTSQKMNELECEAQKKLLQHAEKHLIAAQEAFEQARLEVNRRLQGI